MFYTIRVSRSVANQLVRRGKGPLSVSHSVCQPFSSEPARSATQTVNRSLLITGVSRSVANQLVRRPLGVLADADRQVSAVQ